MQKIRNAFVIVVGVGGVGSHCVNMLARAGVKKIRVIDFDWVTLSSLNWHAYAQRKDVGFSKVEVVWDYVSNIIPSCEVEIVERLFNKDVADTLLGGNPDFVIDCIDNTETKADLITYCMENKIKLVSSMGSGGKIDFTRIWFGSIW